MKLIIFLIVVALIYFIATQIKVVHIDTIPSPQRTELVNRSKLKEMLTSNYIKSNDDFNISLSSSTKNDKMQNFDQSAIVENIKHWFVKSVYKFNVPNKPVTTRYPDNSTKEIDRVYTKYIRKNINRWNDLLDQNFLKMKDLKLVLVSETDEEFMAKANIILSNGNEDIFIEATYHGQIEKTDDPFNKKMEIYSLDLVGIKIISESSFDTSLRQKNNQFMTMSEQMEYVNRVNKMHQEDNF